MDSLDSLYFTIQSNASMGMFPDNKPALFTVHLPTPFNLSGKWVAAIAEIHFPVDFKPHIDVKKLTKPDLIATLESEDKKKTHKLGEDNEAKIEIKRHKTDENLSKAVLIEDKSDTETIIHFSAGGSSYTDTASSEIALILPAQGVKHHHSEVEEGGEGEEGEDVPPRKKRATPQGAGVQPPSALPRPWVSGVVTPSTALGTATQDSTSWAASGVAVPLRAPWSTAFVSNADALRNIPQERHATIFSILQKLRDKEGMEWGHEQVYLDMFEISSRLKDGEDPVHIVKDMSRTFWQSVMERNNALKYVVQRLKTRRVSSINMKELNNYIGSHRLNEIDGRLFLDAYVVTLTNEFWEAEQKKVTQKNITTVTARLHLMGKIFDAAELQRRLEMSDNTDMVTYEMFHDLEHAQAAHSQIAGSVYEYQIPEDVQVACVLKNAARFINEKKKRINTEKGSGSDVVKKVNENAENASINQSVKNVLKLLKHLGIHHIDETFLQTKLEAGIETEVLAKDILLDRKMRQIYDDYAQSVRKCQTVPKYLYIYCDIVENQFVGDKFGPLMRVARVPEDGRKTETKDWIRPHYKPLARNYFHQLQVDIRDEKGCPVSFANGVVIVTLHFKRVV